MSVTYFRLISESEILLYDKRGMSESRVFNM